MDEKVACVKKLGKRNKNAINNRIKPIVNKGSKIFFY